MNDQDLTLSTAIQILTWIPFGTKFFCSMPAKLQHREDLVIYLMAQFLINDCINNDGLRKSASPDHFPMAVNGTSNGGCSYPEQYK